MLYIESHTLSQDIILRAMVFSIDILAHRHIGTLAHRHIGTLSRNDKLAFNLNKIERYKKTKLHP